MQAYLRVTEGPAVRAGGSELPERLRRRTPAFVVSLDFELMWGVRDHRSVRDYGANILRVRQAIPAMLALFSKYQVHATWAAVGMLMFDRKQRMLDCAPAQRPSYENRALSPYASAYLDQVGNTEQSDPYHFGRSLLRRILDTEGMEVGSHTFSHYYCLEKGQTPEQFRADVAAAVAASSEVGVRPVSLVFPRNQFNPAYLAICADQGFIAYRGNEAGWLYRPTAGARWRSLLRRGGRLLDNYVDLSGPNSFMPAAALEPRAADIPASRFLRPYASALRAAEPLRIRRILGAMTASAQRGECFHLWWHPHNFGRDLERNLANLEAVLAHYARLRDTHGVASRTMGELAREVFP